MKKELVKFLNSSYKGSNMTNWQMLVGYWNDNESKHNVDENQPMPNYMNL